MIHYTVVSFIEMGENKGLNIPSTDFYFRITDKIEYDCSRLIGVF